MGKYRLRLRLREVEWVSVLVPPLVWDIFCSGCSEQTSFVLDGVVLPQAKSMDNWGSSSSKKRWQPWLGEPLHSCYVLVDIHSSARRFYSQSFMPWSPPSWTTAKNFKWGCPWRAFGRFSWCKIQQPGQLKMLLIQHVLCKLHWLPVCLWLPLKVLVVIYKGLQLGYFWEWLFAIVFTLLLDLTAGEGCYSPRAIPPGHFMALSSQPALWLPLSSCISCKLENKI